MLCSLISVPLARVSEVDSCHHLVRVHSHVSVTLSSSLLFTWATDNGPSRLCRLLGLILAGDVDDPVWLYDSQHNKPGEEERWLPSHHCIALLQSIFQHAASRMR